MQAHYRTFWIKIVKGIAIFSLVLKICFYLALLKQKKFFVV